MFIILELFKKKKSLASSYPELRSIKVKDIMIKDVCCIHREDMLTHAAHTMIGAHISCLVVLEDYKPIGIITERDFIKKVNMTRGQPDELIVVDIMTKKLFSVDTHLDIFEAQRIMKNHNFRKLVIVEGESLKGIITQTDLCKAVEHLTGMFPNPPLIKNVMTKKVLTVSLDDKFLKAKNIMSSKDVGSVIVEEKGEIRGIFTEFDIVSEFFLNPNRLKNSHMDELMTAPVICVTPDFDLFEVNQFMLEHNFRRLAVVSEHKILGIITQTDVARGIYDYIESHRDFVPNKKAKKPKEPEHIIKKWGSIILYEKKPPKPANVHEEKSKKESKEESEEKSEEEK